MEASLNLPWRCGGRETEERGGRRAERRGMCRDPARPRHQTTAERATRTGTDLYDGVPLSLSM